MNELPDETQTQALARIERREIAQRHPRGELSIELPSGRQFMPLTGDESTDLKAGQLYIGFYNLSGDVPRPRDFANDKGMFDRDHRCSIDPYAWVDREDSWAARNRMLPAGQTGEMVPAAAAESNRESLRSLIAKQPFVAKLRIATAPLNPARRDAAVLEAQIRAGARGWVTHFAIGTRDRVIVGGELNQPIPMMQGNGLKFAIRVRDLLPPPDAMEMIEG